mgnify:CR=1 FL=1
MKYDIESIKRRKDINTRIKKIIFIFLIIHFNEVMRNVLLQKIKSIDFEWTLVYNIFVCF